MYVITSLDTCFVYPISALFTDEDDVTTSYITLAQRHVVFGLSSLIFKSLHITFCLKYVGPTPAPFWDLAKKLFV